MISTNEITIMIILIAFILIASICIGFCIVTFGGKIKELGSGGSIALYFMPIYTFLMASVFLIFFYIYRKEIKNAIDLIRSVKKILPLYELLTNCFVARGIKAPLHSQLIETSKAFFL